MTGVQTCALPIYHQEEAALAAAQNLVEHHLAACVHVDGPFTSIFRWEGKLQREPEWRLIAKTLPAHRAAVIEAIERDHPYDLPGILTAEAEVSEEFATWVDTETKP